MDEPLSLTQPFPGIDPHYRRRIDALLLGHISGLALLLALLVSHLPVLAVRDMTLFDLVGVDHVPPVLRSAIFCQNRPQFFPPN